MKRWAVLFGVAMLIVATLIIGFTGSVEAQSVMELDPIVVEGQIQRPEAAYIIQRANLDFGIIAKKRSFIYKIEQSIDEAPF